jgi:arabinofuranan 3-O-arabinosyltransferase
VRLALRGPSWLVLGEGYNRGWRASCDGRDLGEPVPVDGFANGWAVGRDCREVDLAFAPGKLAGLIGLPSGIACLALLGLVAIRRPPRGPDALPAPLPDPDPPARWPPWRALAVGALAALVLGAIFALRAGVVLGPLVALVLWRGVPTRVLCLAAGLLLGVVVPLCYAIASPADRGGWNTDYAKEVLGAHWVAAAAFALLVVAVGRSIVRRPRGTDADRLADRSRP